MNMAKASKSATESATYQAFSERLMRGSVIDVPRHPSIQPVFLFGMRATDGGEWPVVNGEGLLQTDTHLRQGKVIAVPLTSAGVTSHTVTFENAVMLHLAKAKADKSDGTVSIAILDSDANEIIKIAEVAGAEAEFPSRDLTGASVLAAYPILIASGWKLKFAVIGGTSINIDYAYAATQLPSP